MLSPEMQTASDILRAAYDISDRYGDRVLATYVMDDPDNRETLEEIATRFRRKPLAWEVWAMTAERERELRRINREVRAAATRGLPWYERVACWALDSVTAALDAFTRWVRG